MPPLDFRVRLALLSVLSGALSQGAFAEPLPFIITQKPQPTVAKPPTQREFAEAATTQLGFLASLRDWRNTLRGEGKTPRRDFKAAPLGQNLSLSFGNVAPPLLNKGAGLAARWNMVEIGTTATPAALNQTIARFDSMVSGEKVAVSEAPQMTWLRATPIESKGASIEMSLARGRNDLQKGEGERWRAGTFMNATSHLALPAQWSLRGDFTRAAIDDQAEANSWGLSAEGPIVHPFGVANARGSWREIGTGYGTLNDESAAIGSRNGTLEVTQDVACGPLSGRLQLGGATRERTDNSTVQAGDELAADVASTGAQLRFALTPNLAVSASGSARLDQAKRALSSPVAPTSPILTSPDNAATDSPATGDATTDNAAPNAGTSDNDGSAPPNSDTSTATTPDESSAEITQNALLSPSERRERKNYLTGDVGVEWKFSRALSLAVSTGASTLNQSNQDGDLWSDGPKQQENRYAVEARHHTKTADLRFRIAQRTRRDPIAGSEGFAQSDISQWRIEAGRRLVGPLRFKTILDMARDAEKDQDARRIEAQLQWAQTARFDARYRAGTLPTGLLSDEWNSAFVAPDTAPRQWSARFGMGSAASSTAGLGLAVEYAYSAGEAPDTWRIGVQFK